jgi:hypothetical protein
MSDKELLAALNNHRPYEAEAVLATPIDLSAIARHDEEVIGNWTSRLDEKMKDILGQDWKD